MNQAFNTRPVDEAVKMEAEQTPAEALEANGNLDQVNGEQSNNQPGAKRTQAIARPITRASSKRWIILVLFCLNSGNKAYQWIQIPAATIKASSFYGVDNYVINFASIIAHLAFLFMSWPSCFVIDKIGIRNAVVTASLGATLGSFVKCLSCHLNPSDEFGLVGLMLLGQALVSLSEQLIFSVPSRLVSIWFPDHQVSLALATCLLGNQLGVAIGFVVPQWFLDGAETVAEIGLGFKGIYFWTAVLSLTLFVLNYFLFDEAPLHPPGEARLKQLERERCKALLEEPRNQSVANKAQVMFQQVLRLCKNKDVMLVALVYGISFGRGDAISTLLDQTMQPIYPGDGELVGITGSLIILAGALGLPVWGRILDEWHAYKKVIFILSIASSLSLICLAYATLHVQVASVVYLAAAVFGFFQTGFIVAGLELAVELTYPAPELITATLFNIMPSICGPIFIMIGSIIINNIGPMATYSFYLLTVFAAFVCIVYTHEKLNRQEAREGERQEKGRVHVDMVKYMVHSGSDDMISALDSSRNS